MLKQLFLQEMEKKIKYLIKCQFLKGPQTNGCLENSEFDGRSQRRAELDRRFRTRVSLNCLFSHKDLITIFQ